MKYYFKKLIKAIFWFGLVSSLTLAFFMYNEYSLYNPSQINFKTTSSKVYDNDGNLLYEISFDNAVKNSPVEFSDLPEYCTNAVVATEDKTFWTNEGIDRNGVLRFGLTALSLGRYRAGGSSITQQVIKISNLNIYSRNIVDKFREISHALKLNKKYSKEEIITMYMNNVYMGNLNYGFESASLDYFEKPTSDLNLSECAYLAGVVQGPSIYYPYGNLAAGLRRQKVVLSLMLENKFINEEEYNSAISENLNFTQKYFEIKAPHFIQFLQNEFGIKKESSTDYLPDFTDVDWNESLEIYSYYDYNLHNTLLQILRSKVEEEKDSGINNAAAVVFDKNSNLITMIGSIDFFNDNINGKFNSSLGLRQPGTSLIPLVYKFALDSGYNLEDSISNMPLEVTVENIITKEQEVVLVENSNGSKSSIVSLKSAMENNLEIPAVNIIKDNPEEFENYLKTLGLKTNPKNNSCNEIAILEGCEISIFELAVIYHTFKSTRDVGVIRNIRDLDDQMLYSKQIDDKLALKHMSYGTVQDDQSLAEWEVIKGTVRNNKDLYLIMYNKEYTIGIWFGNTKGDELVNIGNEILNDTSQLIFKIPIFQIQK